MRNVRDSKRTKSLEYCGCQSSAVCQTNYFPGFNVAPNSASINDGCMLADLFIWPLQYLCNTFNNTLSMIYVLFSLLEGPSFPVIHQADDSIISNLE